jgi:hypothetical protein
MSDALKVNAAAGYSGLAALARRCEALPAFCAIEADFSEPARTN